MRRDSIRWRLPASYAVVALLAALSLGSVMLLVLSNYYGAQEQDYLLSNAQGLKPVIEQLLLSRPAAAVLADQVKSLAFFSQTQIRLLDIDGKTISDSGLPDFSQTLSFSSGSGVQTLSLNMPITNPVSGLVGTNLVNGPLITQTNANVPISQTIPGIGANTFVAISASPYGYVFFNPNRYDLSRRSSQTFRISLENNQAETIGWLELSNGPAYGLGILRSVSLAWAAASLVAVMLAALAGWMTSRQFTWPVLALTEASRRMEQGDLEVRVALPARIGFGEGAAQEFVTLSAAFNSMAEQIGQTVATLLSFISDAAHEINTPLTALHTNLELAGSAQTLEQKNAYFERALDQSHRLERLTNGLLDLSRLESGKTIGQVQMFDLGILLRKSAENFAGRAEQAERQFTVDLPDQALWIHGSAQQIERMVENLLENALKFTPPGGAIQMIVELQQSHVFIKIQDTGIGIPPEDLPLLFRRFHRGRNTNHYPGNGLGLAIVKAIVEGHHGTVKAMHGDQGTTFQVELPLEVTQ